MNKPYCVIYSRCGNFILEKIYNFSKDLGKDGFCGSLPYMKSTTDEKYLNKISLTCWKFLYNNQNLKKRLMFRALTYKNCKE